MLWTDDLDGFSNKELQHELSMACLLGECLPTPRADHELEFVDRLEAYQEALIHEINLRGLP